MCQINATLNNHVEAFELFNQLKRNFDSIVRFKELEFKAEYHNGTGYLDKLRKVDTGLNRRQVGYMVDDMGRNIMVLPIFAFGHSGDWEFQANVLVFDRNPMNSGVVIGGARVIFDLCALNINYSWLEPQDVVDMREFHMAALTRKFKHFLEEEVVPGASPVSESLSGRHWMESNSPSA